MPGYPFGTLFLETHKNGSDGPIDPILDVQPSSEGGYPTSQQVLEDFIEWKWRYEGVFWRQYDPLNISDTNIPLNHPRVIHRVHLY